MFLAVVLSLLPVVLVAALALHELLPWWRDYRSIRALPEPTWLRSEK